MENKYKRLAKNSFWTLIGNVGSKTLGFFLLPLYTRWLGTSGFGESDLVTTYSSFLVCIFTMCIADGIFVFTKNESQETKQSFFSSSLLFIFVVLAFWGAIWFILSLLFEYHYIQNSFANNLWLIYGVVIATFLQQYTQQFILSLEKIKLYSSTGIIQSILTLVLSYLLIPDNGVRGYILAMIYANILTAAYSFFFSKSYLYLNLLSFNKERLKDILKYSIPLIPNSMMWWLVSALNRPIMEYNLDYSAIGIFAVANRFPGVISMVFSVFAVAWSISVFEEFGKDGYEEFYKKTFRMLFLCISIVASGVIVFSESIVSIFAAPEFLDAWKYMIILNIGAVFSCMSGFIGTNFSVIKKSKYFFYSSVWGAASSIFFNFLLIPRFGLWGTATSVLLSFVVMMISRYIYSIKFLKVSLLYQILKYFMLLVTASVLTYLLTNLWQILLLMTFVLALLLYDERDIIKPLIMGFKRKF